MFTTIAEGQRFKDFGRNRALLVLGIEPGEKSSCSGPLHPQINYAKCRADHPTGEMSVAWIAVHALLNTAHYKRLPK